MATKLDIIDTGRKSVMLGLSDTNPYKSGSWQAQAWQAGFEQGQDEKTEADTVEAVNREAATRDVYARPAVKLTAADFRTPRPAPRAVLEHLNLLHRAIAVCSDDKRRNRLKAKRAKLAAKWAERVERRG